MKIIAFFVTFLIGSLPLAGLYYWYAHLWLPRLQLTYWAQAYPITVVTIATLMICKGSFGQKLITSLLGLLLIVSAITQVLVWTSLIPHPNF